MLMRPGWMVAFPVVLKMTSQYSPIGSTVVENGEGNVIGSRSAMV